MVNYGLYQKEEIMLATMTSWELSSAFHLVGNRQGISLCLGWIVV
jgi:hypothetical protein